MIRIKSTEPEVVRQELSKYPLEEIIIALVEYVVRDNLEQAVPKIVITEEQFRQYFKVAGLRLSFEPETRGRKKQCD